MVLLPLAGASTYCGSLRLFLQHWMTGFLLAQITDMLASSFVPLELFSVLPQAMLYLGVKVSQVFSVCSIMEGRSCGGGHSLC